MDKHIQVLIYTSYLHIIGGIETFICSFIDLMSPYYDIGVCCPQLHDEMAMRIAQRAPLYRDPEGLSCDSLIMIRIMDNIPRGITYKSSIRMVHCCKTNEGWNIKNDCDHVVHVSEVSKKSFKSTGIVIHNPVNSNDKACLILVSATRIPALDKGMNGESSENLPSYLKNVDEWRSYLREFDLAERSAYSGSVISAQAVQIRAAGEEYVRELISWLEENQNPENGLWEKKISYPAVDGMMKMTILYNHFDILMPYNYKIRFSHNGG